MNTRWVFVITGLFLSLGSKFWHDLLDSLFKFKNVQQRINQKQTFLSADSAEKITALAKISDFEVAQKLYNKFHNELEQIPGVVSVGLNSILDSYTGLFKRVIEVEFTSSKAQGKIEEICNKRNMVVEMNTFYLKSICKSQVHQKIGVFADN